MDSSIDCPRREAYLAHLEQSRTEWRKNNVSEAENEWMDVLQRVPAENRSRLGLGSDLGTDESGMGSKKPKNKMTFIKTNISK